MVISFFLKIKELSSLYKGASICRRVYVTNLCTPVEYPYNVIMTNTSWWRKEGTLVCKMHTTTNTCVMCFYLHRETVRLRARETSCCLARGVLVYILFLRALHYSWDDVQGAACMCYCSWLVITRAWTTQHLMRHMFMLCQMSRLYLSDHHGDGRHN